MPLPETLPPWDPDIILLLAELAPEDANDARIWWQNYAPQLYQAMLDAGLLDHPGAIPRNRAELEDWIRHNLGPEPDPGQESQWLRWFALGLLIFFIGGIYYDQRGSPIPSPRAVLDNVLTNARQAVRDMCNTFREGGMSLAELRERMTHEIRMAHYAAAALQRGGIDKLSEADHRLIRDRIAQELERLNALFLRVLSGEQPRDGTLCRHLQQFVGMGRWTYHLFEVQQQQERGKTEYRNLLHSADTCGGDTPCAGESKKGWVPIGELVPIGERTCGGNCLCSYEFR